jgi:DNA (cytosine-5)-methyltransferase 1
VSATQGTIYAADLFCGAGGTSQGLLGACQAMGLDLDLVAVNHWQLAIDSHSANHPYAQHYCESLDNLDPRKLVKNGRLNLMVASPECTHHSVARGGKPCSDQSRSTAWHVLRWAEAIYIENIIIENVKEFRSWGPLGADGQPMKSKRGELFFAFINGLKALGYDVEHKILNAADYGDATTRERLFIIARRGGRKIIWPKATHAPASSFNQAQQQFAGNQLQPWRTARQIIDWTIPGKSIFARKKPLAPKTMNRIAAGIKKYVTPSEPFLVMLYGSNTVRSLDQPLPTVTANGGHIALCEPFIVNIDHQGGNGDQTRAIDKPLATITTKARAALVEPFLVAVNHGDTGTSASSRVASVDEPLATVTCKRGTALVQAFLIGSGGPEYAAKPKSIDDPVGTVMTENHKALVQAFLVKYNATAKAQSVDDPLDTVTTKDRFALVTTEHGTFAIDIRFRMLEPHELAAAQGLDNYVLKGNKQEIVKQIGNAVPRNMAMALCSQVLSEARQ